MRVASRQNTAIILKTSYKRLEKTFAKAVGWVSPTGRNPTNGNAIHEDVGLRDETANPTYTAAFGTFKVLPKH